MISSARMRLAKMGPFLGTNCRLVSSQISVPIRSAGSRSGVNWMR